MVTRPAYHPCLLVMPRGTPCKIGGYGATRWGHPSRQPTSLFSVTPSYHAAPDRSDMASPMRVALDGAPWSFAALPMRDALDGTPPGRTLVLIHSAPSSYLRSALFIM